MKRQMLALHARLLGKNAVFRIVFAGMLDVAL
jgi:hypothetical protein